MWELNYLHYLSLKLKMKEELKQKENTFFSEGSQIGYILMTRIWLERSELNLHQFLIGQYESAECRGHYKNELSQHFLIACFLIF